MAAPDGASPSVEKLLLGSKGPVAKKDVFMISMVPEERFVRDD